MCAPILSPFFDMLGRLHLSIDKTREKEWIAEVLVAEKDKRKIERIQQTNIQKKCFFICGVQNPIQ